MSTPMMCENCHKNAATVFIARVENGHADKQRLCENCAREITGKNGWIKIMGNGFQLDLQNLQNLQDLSQFDISDPFSDVSDEEINEEFAELLEMTGDDDDEETGIPISDEDFAAMMEAAGIEISDSGADFQKNFSASLEENSDAATAAAKAFQKLFESTEAEADEPQSSGSTPKIDGKPEGAHGLNAERCAKCGTTWDRLREDGRVGCAQCYSAFHEKLIEVMGRMQRETHHVGKTPREASRRHRRLEHLRARRDHRLEMLNRRLQEAVTSENFEDAARLRDKIKMVSSTIVSDE